MDNNEYILKALRYSYIHDIHNPQNVHLESQLKAEEIIHYFMKTFKGQKENQKIKEEVARV